MFTCTTIVGMSHIRKDRFLIERKRVGLSQEDLAKRVGIDRSYISKIETGKPNNLGIETLYDLARELGVSPLYLLGETENPLRGIDDEELINTEEVSSWAKELLNLLEKMSPGDKTFMLELARKLQRADNSRIVGNE